MENIATDSLPNLLIVDDNPSNLILLEIILEKSQVNLIKAESGFEALDKSKGIELALAILDIQMPGMNGFELAVKINEERGNNRVPIVFITANHVNELNVSQGYISGAVDYIFKPINSQILRSKVNIFLDLFNHKQTIIRESILLEKNAEKLIWLNSALKTSEEKYRSYIDNAPDGIFVVNETGQFSEVNKAACRMTGYSNDELLKVSFTSLIEEESVKDRDAFLKEIIETGTARSEMIHRHKDGSKRWWNLNANKLSETRFLVFAKDITQRREAVEELQKSEELFRSVVYNSTELTTLTNADGTIIFISPQCKSVFGYPYNKLIGEQMPDFIHAEDVGKYRQAWEWVLYQGQEQREFEYRIFDEEGTIRWMSQTSKQVKVNGRMLGVQSTIRNITEHIMDMQAKKISEEKYKTLLNASPDGILLIDLKGTIIEVSEIGLELFGAGTRDDLVGKDFSQFVPPDEENTLNEIIEKTMSEGLVQNIEMKIRKINRSIFAGETSATLIQGSDGAPISFMITIRDISQRKKLETKQLHADRMANLGEMASGIAHEINQPLNIISMVMDKILFEACKAETVDIEFLKSKSDKIFENITRIKNIIDHVRAFSRSDDNYVLTAFNINSSIDNAVSMIMEQFKHLDINLNTQLDQQIPQIVGNTHKFEQVIVNLLTNAKDAVLERRSKQNDYRDLKVEIITYLENQFLIVEIIDNGIGIDKGDIHNIMLPFYTTKEEGKGTGLGLSICYQIIKEMNGTIDIASDGVNGTKIKLVIDIQKPN